MTLGTTSAAGTGGVLAGGAYSPSFPSAAAAQKTRTERSRAAGVLAAIGYALLMLVAAYRRASGLDPPSLWLNDAWVGFIVKYATASDLFTYSASAPIGFVAISKLFRGVTSDPELSLQLFPFLCALLLIPAVGILVTRLTGWKSLGLLAAALIAVNREVSEHSIQVKQYGTEALAVTLLLTAGLPHLRDASPRRLGRLGLGSLAALLVGYVSAAVSALLTHIPLANELVEWLRGRKPFPWRACAVVAALDACVLVFYLLRLRHQSNPFLVEKWSRRGFFLPTDSVASMLEFLARHGSAALGEAFPRGAGWTSVESLVAAGLLYLFLVLAGVVYLFGSGSRRLEGGFYVSLYSAMLIASAARLYPFGSGRTWIFMHPVTISLGCLGLYALLDAVVERGWAPWRLAAASLGLASLAVILGFDARPAYPPYRDAQLIARMESIAAKDDLVLVHPLGRNSVGFYTSWQIEPSFPRGAGEAVFPYRGVDRAIYVFDLLAPRFPEELLAAHARVLYIEIHVKPSLRPEWRFVADSLAARGYRPTSVYEEPRARLIVYERQTVPGAPVPIHG